MATKKSKYGNRKIERDGEVFDSLKEYRRYCELLLLERAGEITGLMRQVPFELIPAQRETPMVGKRGGVKPGKVIERAIVYYADFTYHKDGKLVVEDTKGVKTKEYIIKRKLLLYAYGIRIKEV